MQIRYGIVSTATITDRFIQAVFAAGDTVTAIASRNEDKAKCKAAFYHIPKAYGSYQALFQDPDVDVIYIATNNGSHQEYIESALLHHKHVVCEKPIALSGEDAKALFHLAKTQGCFLMEAQKSLFLPATIKLKEVIEQKLLGALHQIEMTSSFSSPTTAWMHDPAQGGVIYGSASYTIEYLDGLLRPTTWTSNCIKSYETNGTIDAVAMCFLMDEILVSSMITMRGPTANRACFYFQKGRLELPDYWKARSMHIHTANEVKTLEFPCVYEMTYEVQHIHACLVNGYLESPIMTSSKSIRCCSLVDSLIESHNAFVLS